MQFLHFFSFFLSIINSKSRSLYIRRNRTGPVRIMAAKRLLGNPAYSGLIPQECLLLRQDYERIIMLLTFFFYLSPSLLYYCAAREASMQITPGICGCHIPRYLPMPSAVPAKTRVTVPHPPQSPTPSGRRFTSISTVSGRPFTVRIYVALWQRCVSMY